MLNEIQNEMFLTFVQEYLADQWELVHLLDGVDATGLSDLPPEEKEAVRVLVDGMRPMTDGIADGLRDGEWSDAASPELAPSIEALRKRLAEIRSAIQDDAPT